VTVQLQKLNKKPVDPKTSVEYEYSTTSNFKEYQLKIELEDGLANNSVMNQAQAATTIPRVKGTYNEMYLDSGTGTYYAVPSLFVNGTTFSIDGQEIEFTPVNI